MSRLVSKVRLVCKKRLTECHVPDEKLAELLGYIELIDTKLMYAFGKCLSEAAHLDTLHGTEHCRSGGDALFNGLQPHCLSRHDKARCS